MNKTPPLAALSLLVVGCAATKPMTLGPDHPASPAAADAPVPDPSKTLATTGPAGVPQQAEAAHAGHDHHQHDAGGMNMSSGEGAAVPATATAAPGASATQPGSRQATYTCPMHPEVVSDKPGKCPKCGMTLVRKGGN